MAPRTMADRFAEIYRLAGMPDKRARECAGNDTEALATLAATLIDRRLGSGKRKRPA